MPVKPLPVNPNLDHLKAQAKDLLKARVQCEPAVAQLCGAAHPGILSTFSRRRGHHRPVERILKPGTDQETQRARLTIERFAPQAPRVH